MARRVDQIDQEGVGLFNLLGDVCLVLVRKGVKEGDSSAIKLKIDLSVPVVELLSMLYVLCNDNIKALFQVSRNLPSC